MIFSENKLHQFASVKITNKFYTMKGLLSNNWALLNSSYNSSLTLITTPTPKQRINHPNVTNISLISNTIKYLFEYRTKYAVPYHTAIAHTTNGTLTLQNTRIDKEDSRRRCCPSPPLLLLSLEEDDLECGSEDTPRFEGCLEMAVMME